ncbi:MAG: ornithine carbamoyltransferase [Bryobacteraceae bacterium]|nr:ornithine carbamoyltransferase [Bryobacteraceae bacterium]
MAATLSQVPVLKTKAQNLTTDLDLTVQELSDLLDLASHVKANPRRYSNSLTGRYVSLLFEKPSLRTRFTFELAIKHLGGDAVTSIGPVGEREPLKDIARNLERWTNAIVARTFSQATIDALAHWASVPVINALSDLYHPCQALADMQTLREHFGNDLRNRRLCFVGDGNNVSHSLMLCAVRLGMHYSIATPVGYAPDSSVVAEANRLCASGATVSIGNDPHAAARNADAIYTDVWASMGQESEAAARDQSFRPYQVNLELMASASRDCLFMHCLPAHRGDEVTDDVIESANSVVFNQAENRLHAQKALLLMLVD